MNGNACCRYVIKLSTRIWFDGLDSMSLRLLEGFQGTLFLDDVVFVECIGLVCLLI